MKKLTILVDLDDVCWDLLGAWIAYLNFVYGLDKTKADITQWDMKKIFPELSANQIYIPLQMEHFWKTVSPLDGAKDAIEKLIEDGHDVYVVTATDPLFQKGKFECFYKAFPNIGRQNVITAHNKQMIRGDVMVDDNPRNLEGGNYYRLLMSAPHNFTYDAKENGMTRVSSWGDIYNRICKFAAEQDGKPVGPLDEISMDEYLSSLGTTDSYNPSENFTTRKETEW